jgi:transglutaminase-like putative cysteine protease
MSADSGTHPRSAFSGSDVSLPKMASSGDFWFRFFNHATLAMAGVCLVHGEAFFLPPLPWCLPPYLALLVAAFRAEGRWTLGNKLANMAGVCIVIVMILWVRYQPGGPGVLKDVDALSRLVPYIGPFLMALLAVQLFRPRGPHDFWVLQGMGFVQVALGCVLAISPLFGVLMAIYLTCALSCLALHYLAAPGTIGKPPSWRWLLGFVARFSLAVAASSLSVFLITPRSQAPAWDPLQRFANRASQSARWPQFAPNQGANLNGSTPIELSNDAAFTIRVVDRRGPKLDLPSDIRFRTFVLETYQDGVWPSDPFAAGYRGMGLQRPRHRELLPDFGSSEYTVHFDVNLKENNGLVLAEPVLLGRFGETRTPVVLTDFNKPHAPLFFIQPYSGTLLPVPTLAWTRYRYKQVLAPTRIPNRVPADISGGRPYIQELTRQGLPRLESWTAAVLRQLVENRRYRLSPDALVPDPRWPARSYNVPEAYWEPVARAMCDYLANSGEYTYSLDQPRKNFNIDPVEDLLFNVKQGHCERYASALVLMLRTQGVPARLIKGFRGADSLGGGAYVVRQNMAHAWVEVLVKRPGDDPGPGHEWLTLDPTPGVESARQPSPVAGWWHDKTSAGATMWQQLIVGYDANRRADVLAVVAPPSVLSAIFESAKWNILAVVAYPTVVIIGFVLLRARRSRRAVAVTAAGVACYLRLVRLLARRVKLRRAPWQTPRELADAACAFLAGQPATTALADLPDRIVDLFYRVRFGGESPEATELALLNSRLDELASALTHAAPLSS